MRISFIKHKLEKHNILDAYISGNFDLRNYSINPKEITWITNSYVSNSIGGSEYMSHTINKFLINHGFKINVIGKWETQIYEDIQLINVEDKKLCDNALGKCKFIFSQNYHYPEFAVRLGDILNKKVIIFIHTTLPSCDPSPSNYIHLMKNIDNLRIIYNSTWISEIYSSIKSKCLIITPPLKDNIYIKKNTNCYISLINISIDKGGQHLIDIARSLPQYEFLGVGNYGVIDSTIKNITYLPSTYNVSDIYSKSDIILVPSVYESWGMVASESIANGIPVIASDTPGLRENLDYAGLFVNRDSIHEWVSLILKLKLDRTFYDEMKLKSLKRSKELINLNKHQLNGLKHMLLNL